MGLKSPNLESTMVRKTGNKIAPGVLDDRTTATTTSTTMSILVTSASTQQHWVEVRNGGIKLHVYQSSGSSSQTSTQSDAVKNRLASVFFIHGVAGSSEVWKSQIETLSAHGYRVIAPDLIGHGLSCAPDNEYLYKFHDIAEDCLCIFDKFCSDVNYVVGHSYGTSFAAYLAHYRMSKVQKLVLMSGGAPLPLAPQRGLFSLPTLLLSCFKPAITKLFFRKAFHRNNAGLSNKEVAFNVPLYVLRYVMKGQVWHDGGESFHKTLVQPVLLLHGEDDQLEVVEDTLEMHAVLQQSQLHIIPGTGHMIMMEKSAVVNRLILNFIKDVPEHRVRSTSPASLEDRHATRHGHHHSSKSIPNLKIFT